MLALTRDKNAVLLPVKIVPGASRTRYLGPWQGHARIAVAAPPERGKANKAVIAYLADLMGVRKRDVSIVAGQTAPTKRVRIERTTVEAALAALQAAQS